MCLRAAPPGSGPFLPLRTCSLGTRGRQIPLQSSKPESELSPGGTQLNRCHQLLYEIHRGETPLGHAILPHHWKQEHPSRSTRLHYSQANCVQAEHTHTHPHTQMAYLDILKAFSLLWSPAWATVPACLQDLDSAAIKGVNTHHETTA